MKRLKSGPPKLKMPELKVPPFLVGPLLRPARPPPAAARRADRGRDRRRPVPARRRLRRRSRAHADPGAAAPRPSPALGSSRASPWSRRSRACANYHKRLAHRSRHEPVQAALHGPVLERELSSETGTTSSTTDLDGTTDGEASTLGDRRADDHHGAFAAAPDRRSPVGAARNRASGSTFHGPSADRIRADLSSPEAIERDGGRATKEKPNRSSDGSSTGSCR